MPGQRPWWKVKARSSLDLVVGAIGDLAAPTALVLARPGGVRSFAVTRVLPRRLVSTEETWQRLVAEVSADVAVDSIAGIE